MSHRNPKRPRFLLLVRVLLLSAKMASFDEAPPGNSKAGEKIFRTKCAQCHTVEKGAGHKQGPSLISSSLVVDPSLIISLFESI